MTFVTSQARRECLMTKNKEEGIEDCRACVVRKGHRKKWKAKVDAGDKDASLCVCVGYRGIHLGNAA
jgi:hypothetical protein